MAAVHEHMTCRPIYFVFNVNLLTIWSLRSQRTSHLWTHFPKMLTGPFFLTYFYSRSIIHDHYVMFFHSQISVKKKQFFKKYYVYLLRFNKNCD